MDSIKRIIACNIPIEACNLRCHYCFITQKKKFSSQIPKFEYSPREIQKALSVKRLGGKCLINMTASGETLLSNEIIPIARALLEEGHYIELVTNGTITKRFNEIIELPKSLLERLFFKFSFHYLELIRLNFLDTFFYNVNIIRNAGCSFTIEITPNDELVEHIDEIKKICTDRLHALPHLTIARDDREIGIPILSQYSFNDYINIWGKFNSDLFEFKSSIFYKKRTEFCYAGNWSLYINLMSGSAKQCYIGHQLKNIYTNIDSSLNYLAIGNNCRLPHCYNGHAFLTLGVIPKLKTPTYASVRNRKDKEGREWLNEPYKSFINRKLCISNKEYSFLVKLYINIQNKLLQINDISFLNKTKNRVRKIVRKKFVK